MEKQLGGELLPRNDQPKPPRGIGCGASLNLELTTGDTMASIFKQQYKSGGKVKKSKKWYLEFVDHLGTSRRLPGFPDRKLTAEMARKLERLASMRKLNQPPDSELTEWLESSPSKLKQKLADWGLLDHRSTAESLPLSNHLEDYRKHLLGKGDTKQHVSQTHARIKAAFDGCRFVFISDLDAGKLHDWLADQRSNGMAVQTSNYYQTAAKGFTRWMVRDRRLSSDPFIHLRGLNARTDKRRERRSLSHDNFGRFLNAARASVSTFRGLTGRDRYVLYLCAARTGLRAGELASLTEASFDLTSEPATVTIGASNEKGRRGAVLPLGDEVAGVVAEWLADRNRNTASLPLTGRRAQPLWPGSWSQNAAMMLRDDLAAARAAWIKEAKSDPSEQERREQSDRLSYTDDDGHVFDFHALRGQFITDLGRAGVSLQDAQKLARHSDPKLTASVYTHLSVTDLGRSVNKLPALPNQAEPMQATGTDDDFLQASLQETGAKQYHDMPQNGQSTNRGESAGETKKPANPKGNAGFGEKEENRAGETRTRNKRIMSPLL